jgi:flagellar basal-body rod modification protein FlgD
MMSGIDAFSGLPSNVPRAGGADAVTAPKNTLGTTPQEVQQNFMRLLLAQISNQNPLNPSDPAEMTAQLSQLNTVSSLETLNSNMRSMLSQVSAQAFMGAASLIGREVLIPSNTMVLEHGAPSSFGLRLLNDTPQVVIGIASEDGTIVDEIALGGLAQGMHAFSWDGKDLNGRVLPEGRYSLVELSGGAGPSGIQMLAGSVVVAAARDGDRILIRTADGRTTAAADVAQMMSNSRTEK